MTDYQKGQEVEVYISTADSPDPFVSILPSEWRKATIAEVDSYYKLYIVQFPDGTRAVVEAEHIRSN